MGNRHRPTLEKRGRVKTFYLPGKCARHDGSYDTRYREILRDSDKIPFLRERSTPHPPPPQKKKKLIFRTTWKAQPDEHGRGQGDSRGGGYPRFLLLIIGFSALARVALHLKRTKTLWWAGFFRCAVCVCSLPFQC